MRALSHAQVHLLLLARLGPSFEQLLQQDSSMVGGGVPGGAQLTNSLRYAWEHQPPLPLAPPAALASSPLAPRPPPQDDHKRGGGDGGGASPPQPAAAAAAAGASRPRLSSQALQAQVLRALQQAGTSAAPPPGQSGRLSLALARGKRGGGEQAQQDGEEEQGGGGGRQQWVALARSARPVTVAVEGFSVPVDCALEAGGRMAAVLCHGADRQCGANGAAAAVEEPGGAGLLLGEARWCGVLLEHLGWSVLSVTDWEWPRGGAASSSCSSPSSLEEEEGRRRQQQQLLLLRRKLSELLD